MLIYDYINNISNSDGQILDVGCKDGRWITGSGAEVIALDIKVDPTYNDLDYITADGAALPFKTNSFDYVVTNQVLEHIPNEKKEPFIREISRVLKSDGELLLSFPNRLWVGNPHQLPAGYSLLPRSVGLRLSAILSEDAADYYKDHVFNISPLGARLLLKKFFGKVDYATVSILQEVRRPTKDSWNRMKSVVDIAAPVFRMSICQACFELVFPYSAYRCTHPKESVTTF